MPAVFPGRGGGGCWSFDLTVASHVGVFRGACISSLVERDEIRALLKTPAWEANLTDTLHITTHHYPSLHIPTLWQQWNKWKYKFCKWLGRNRKFVRWWKLRKTDHSKEIHEHVSKLKTKKASTMDSLLDEMIKHGRYFLRPSLEKIFNDILNSGKFPTEWNIGVIKTIYKKKGDRRSGPQQITSGAPNGNFRENICSEDDLRSRIFRAFVVKFLACLLLLGFSNIYKMV